MNRKTFLSTSLSIIGVSIWPDSWKNLGYPTPILLGKGNPELYSIDIPLLKPVGVAFKEMQHSAEKEGMLSSQTAFTFLFPLAEKSLINSEISSALFESLLYQELNN